MGRQAKARAGRRGTGKDKRLEAAAHNARLEAEAAVRAARIEEARREGDSVHTANGMTVRRRRGGGAWELLLAAAALGR